MTRKECLDMAAQCVLQDRASQYGGPEDTFGRIAKLWSAYLGTKLDGTDVAAMMGLLKIARLRANPTHGDSWIDLAGYAACGAELAGKAEAYRQFIEKAGAEYKKLRAEAEAKDEAQPKYRPGDSLLVTMPEGEDVHCVYIGESTHPGCCCVRYESGDLNGETDDTVPIDQIRREPAPKAEGCEELVQKDAPQTPAELCQHIVDSNPATYGRPHNPTGEELAEMAKEDAHG